MIAATPSLSKTKKLFRKPYLNFVSKRSGPFKQGVTLDRNRVYILPTKSGIIFSILLLILLIGSVNYDKSLGFILTFLLVGIGNIALLATWKNLAGLRLSAGGNTPVFLNDNARFTVLLENTDAKTKFAIGISHEANDFETIDVDNTHKHAIHFEAKTKTRGYCDAGKFRLYTEFPMGLFVAWTVIDLAMSCLVYPKPVSQIKNTMVNALEDGDQNLDGKGIEEYTGLKKYQDGESWRRISWKAMARNNELFTKQFSGGQPQSLWIKWDDVTVSDTETRLSILSRKIIDAHENHHIYGLQLPQVELAPGSGNRHYHQCMKLLATYGN